MNKPIAILESIFVVHTVVHINLLDPHYMNYNSLLVLLLKLKQRTCRVADEC